MQSWKQKLTASALALAVAVPSAVFADSALTAAQTSDAGAGAKQTKALQWLHHKRHGGWGFWNGPHKEMYFSLLAEKYTPQDLDAWKKALDENQRLRNELKSLRNDAQWKQKRAQLMEEWKQKRAELEAKVKSGEITRDQMKEEIKKWREEMKQQAGGGKNGPTQEQIAAHKQLYEQFTKAVESGDAAQIKAVLPKLLDELNKRNEQLAKKLEEWKKNGDGTSASSVQ